MKLLRFVLLCFFVSTLNASNFLKIAVGDEFKSPSATNVYLRCINISPYPELKDFFQYKFSIYLSSTDVSNLSTGSLELAYNSSLNYLFLSSLNIKLSPKVQEYETAAIIIAFKACISKLTKLPDNFWTLLSLSDKDTSITLSKIGFKSGPKSVVNEKLLMQLSLKDFLKKYPEPAQLTLPDSTTTSPLNSPNCD